MKNSKKAVEACAGAFWYLPTRAHNPIKFKRFLKPFKGVFPAYPAFPPHSKFPIFHFFGQGGIYA
jgi:hypothetical protein